MSGSFSWHLLVSFDLWQCLGGIWGTSWGVWGVSGGCLRVSECYFWKSEALRCVLGSQPLQYGAISLFWHCPERHDFFAPDHSETFKYQNVYIWGWQKWLGYMISLFFNARQKDMKNGSCKWSPCRIDLTHQNSVSTGTLWGLFLRCLWDLLLSQRPIGLYMVITGRVGVWNSQFGNKRRIEGRFG